MPAQKRLNGIDLFRGIAILAVIILHSDEGISNLPLIWQNILYFCGFAVPFFLATSFYLGVKKIYLSQRKYQLKERLFRLLQPYVVWTIIYLIYKSAKYYIVGDTQQLSNLIQDPIGVLVLGGATFHLYFLPLLISGTILLYVIQRLIKKIELKTTIGLLSLSLLTYEFLLQSGNAFDLQASIAFQSLLQAENFTQINPLVRITMTGVAWSLRCMPYIFLAAILNQLEINYKLKFTWQVTAIALAIFIVVNCGYLAILPSSLLEIIRGYSGLIFALGLSNFIPNNPVISNLSICSFGIYLVHLIVVESLTAIDLKLEVSSQLLLTTNLMIFSFISLAISWIITSILLKRKLLSLLLFGI